MSNIYRRAEDVPTHILVNRLHELAKAAPKNCPDHSQEFTLRVPVELDRDADVVLHECAKRLGELSRKFEQDKNDDAETDE